MDLTGLGSVFNGVMGLIGTQYAADQSYDAAMNTNAAQERMWNKAQANEQKRFTDSLMENRYLTDLAYKRTIEQRDYENWYNTPEQQVQRYRDAGLNPYLMMSGQNALGSVSAGSASVGSPPSGYSAPAPPHLNVPLIPDYGSAFGNLLGNLPDLLLKSQDLSYKRISTITSLIESLSKDNNITPENKDKILHALIGKALYADDQSQKRQKLINDHQLTLVANDAAMSTMKLSIQNEENAAKRKEWSYLANKYEKDLSIMTQELLRISQQNKWLDDEGRLKKAGADALEYEVEKIKRENDLFKGDISFRSILELIQKMFTGNAILGLIGKML